MVLKLLELVTKYPRFANISMVILNQKDSCNFVCKSCLSSSRHLVSFHSCERAVRRNVFYAFLGLFTKYSLQYSSGAEKLYVLNCKSSFKLIFDLHNNIY